MIHFFPEFFQHLFSVVLNQLNASFLNESINFFKKTYFRLQTGNIYHLKYQNKHIQNVYINNLFQVF